MQTLTYDSWVDEQTVHLAIKHDKAQPQYNKNQAKHMATTAIVKQKRRHNWTWPSTTITQTNNPNVQHTDVGKARLAQ